MPTKPDQHTQKPKSPQLALTDLVLDYAGVFGVATEYSLSSPETLNRIREHTVSCSEIQNAVRRNPKAYEFIEGIYYFIGS